jgi:hypothetical protein
MAGAVVFSSLADDGSMLAAMRRVEHLRLDDDTRRQAYGPVTWDDIWRTRDAAIRRLPEQEAHFATRRVLDLLSEAASGVFDWPTGVQKAADEVVKDADNLAARLAYAVLLDMYTVEHSSDSTAPQRRAYAIREIVDGEPRAAGSTFHNAGFLQMWIKVLDGFFERPDVAASLAPERRHGEIRQHHTVLPLVCDHVLELRSKLIELGAAEDAEACTRWLVECLAGLMLSETDADTRLLCAELIARAAPVDSKVARDMHALRRAYHDAARRAPIDLCDQAFTSSPSIAPDEYRRALWLLVACLSAAAVAVGAAVSLLALCLIAPIVARFVPNRTPSLPITRPWLTRLALAIVPAGLCIAAISIQVDRNGLYAQSWAILLGLTAVSIGMVTTILLASFCTVRGKGSKPVSALSEQSRNPSPTPGRDGAPRQGVKRFPPMAACFVAALFIALPFVPPALLTRVYRGLDLAVGALWIVIPVAIGLIAFAKHSAPARWGTFAATAALVSCLNACLAVGLCFCHSAADERYQQAAVKGYADEVAARLGSDWQAVYLDELLRTYEVPG